MATQLDVERGGLQCEHEAKDNLFHSSFPPQSIQLCPRRKNTFRTFSAFKLWAGKGFSWVCDRTLQEDGGALQWPT